MRRLIIVGSTAVVIGWGILNSLGYFAHAQQSRVVINAANQLGVGIEPLQWLQTDGQQALRATGEARIRWARTGFDRASVHLGPGRYKWDAMDRIVASATGQGVQFLGILGYSPPWDTTGPPDDYGSYPPRSYDQWADYVFQTVSRYRNRVQHWEVWNEPDPDGFWEGTPGEYAHLLAVAYREVKRADPGAKVLLGGLIGHDPSVEFFQTIMADPSYPAGANFDIMNIHTYGTRAEARATIGQFLSLSARPLWVTEMGWPTDPALQAADPDFCCGEEAQARYLTAVMPELLELGADKVFWWTLWIPDDSGEGEPLQTYGLLDGQMRPKPAYFALRDLIRGSPSPTPTPTPTSTTTATPEPTATEPTPATFTVTGAIVHQAGVSPKTDYVLGFYYNDESEAYSYELPASGGPFKIADVPGGKYSVYLWNEDPRLVLPDPFKVDISSRNASNAIFALGKLEVRLAVEKISGRVFNSRDNKGLPNITVVAQTDNSHSAYLETKTDKDGNYELKVFPGHWTVWLDLSDRKDIVQGSDPAQVTVNRGEPVTGIDFPVIVADAKLKGVVTLDGLTPLADLSGYIEFHPIETPDLPSLGVEVEKGQFSIQLPAATYGVWLYLAQDSKYGLTTIQPFQQITLASGESKTLQATVKKRDAIIEGSLRDAKGKIITGVPVQVYAATGEGLIEETNVDTKTGRYQLQVYSGVYQTWTISYAIGETERAFHYDYVVNHTLPVSANGRVTQDIILYEADSPLSGKVYDSSGQPLADVVVAYSNTDDEGNLFNPDGPHLYGSATTGNDGSYELFLLSGKYRLSAHLEGYISPSDQVVKISSDNPGKADFKFLPVEATIFGRVYLGDDPVWAMVWAWSEGGASLNVHTDAEGNFVFNVSKDVWHLGAVTTVGNRYYVSDEITVDTAKDPAQKVVLKLRLEREYEYILPPPVSRTFEAGQLAILTIDDGTKITVPAGAIKKSGKLTLVASPNVFLPVEAQARPIGLGYDLQARDASDANISQFLSDVFIAIPYTKAQLDLYGLTEEDLIPSYWDEKSGTWLPVKNVTVDKEHGYIVVATDHFTRFALITHKPITQVAGIPPVAVRQLSPEQLKVAAVKKSLPLSLVAPGSGNIALITVILVIVVLAVIYFVLKAAKKRKEPLG